MEAIARGEMSFGAKNHPDPSAIRTPTERIAVGSTAAGRFPSSKCLAMEGFSVIRCLATRLPCHRRRYRQCTFHLPFAMPLLGSRLAL
jgi:hypothetical protein